MVAGDGRELVLVQTTQPEGGRVQHVLTDGPSSPGGSNLGPGDREVPGLEGWGSLGSWGEEMERKVVESGTAGQGM